MGLRDGYFCLEVVTNHHHHWAHPCTLPVPLATVVPMYMYGHLCCTGIGCEG